MISNQLGHIVSLQLLQHPLVVIPGFGGFVKDYISAELDEKRNRIHPPKNTIAFNPRLVHNDGLLVAAWAAEYEVSYADADNQLTDAIAELRFRLSNGENVEWAHIGRLQQTASQHILFEPTSNTQTEDEFFGLKPVSIREIETDNVDKVRQLVGADGAVATKVRTLPIKRIASYAAAAVTVGFLMWMPMQTGVLSKGKSLAHQLNPFAFNTEASYQPRTFDETWITKGFERPDVLSDKYSREYLSVYITKDAAQPIVVKTDAVPSKEVTLNTVPASAKPENKPASSFQVIAAAFNTKKEARAYVSIMVNRGFSAQYAGTNNSKHLVAYGTYKSMADAQKMLASVSLSNKQAHIISVN